MRATSVIRSPPIVESMHPSHVPSKPCKNKKLEDAFHMVDLMDWHGMPISRDAIYDLLQACTQQRDLEAGMHTYCLMIKNGLDSITVLVDHLIRLFVSCGSLVDARATFSKVLKPTVYTWNAIISAHDKLATSESALALYEEMQEEGTQPNSFTFLCILKACGSVASVEKGRQIHDQIIRSVLEPNLIVGNALIHMYVQCGALNEARKVFDGLLVRDVVSWGTIISGYAQHGHAVLSVELLKKMQHERIKPERVTFLCILKACGSIGSSWQGRCVHDQILKSGLESDVAVGSALVDMYAKCMSLDEAQKVFDQLPNRNVVSWGALLAGFVQHGYGLYALDLFEQMKLEIAKLDTSIFSCILKACGIVGVKGATRLIHGDIIRCGVELDTIVGSALVDTYGKCGSIEDARVVFDELPHRDVVTWGLMIEAYAQHGKSLFALALFERMQIKGIWPDKVTFLGVAKACGSLGALKQGLWIHSQVVECGLESDLLLGNTVIDMYGKCGSLEDAWEVFNKLPNRDAASWGAIIASLARFGNLRLAQQCLGDMQRHGMKPSVMIFSSIFTACSHAGHLKEGWSYFKSLKKDYDITPRVEHCNCMLDILGRLGHLHEAEHLLKTLPIPPNVVGWMALLTACKTYGNIELGTRCFKKVLVLDPDEASVYMLMSSIYAGAQMWKEVDKMNEMRSHVGAQKKPGMAWIEVSGKVNEFTVGGKSHQQSKEIIEMLQALSRLMQEEGYVPALDSVLEPMLGEVKEAVACVETMGFGFPQCT